MLMRRISSKGIAVALIAAVMASCSLMKDDRSECPMGLYVSFVYNYNIDRADMFRDQVGAVTVYVFDEQDRLVRTEELKRPAAGQPIRTLYTQDDIRYQMHIQLSPGRYRLLALAQQSPYGDLLNQSGAKFRRDFVTPSTYTDLSVTLDRQDTTGSNYKLVPNHGTPLDTLWHGSLKQYAVPDTALTTGRQILSDDFIEVKEDRPTFATVGLIRDSKDVHVSLRSTHEDVRSTLSNTDFEITITDQNGHIAWDNSVTDTDTLLYIPYAQWTTRATAVGSPVKRKAEGVIAEQAAHYDFSLSRLIYSADATKNAIMRIRHIPSDHVVGEFNLTHLLSQGRTHPELTRYSEQEFLDRESRYNLEMILIGTGAEQRIAYVELSISILGWAKRIQYEVL